MTQARLSEIKAALKKRNDAQAEYDKELYQNTVGHNNEKVADWTLPYNNVLTNEAFFRNWLTASDSSLSIKKDNLDTAQTQYDEIYKYNTADQKAEDDKAALDAQNAFNLAHPDTVAEIAKTKITADAQAVLDAAKQTFAQKNTKYFVWLGIGIGVLLLIYGARKVFGGKIKPAAV